MNDINVFRADCRFFRGDVPCTPHKKEGVHCEGCPYYEATDRNILIIKLGAIGDVIRTTPLLHKLKEQYPSARIWWMTLTPAVLPSMVDIPLELGITSVISVLATSFDLLINLDKDREACALTDRISASVKKGYTLQNGICAPIDNDARHKFLTGIFDDLNRANRKHYVEEIFGICGFDWKGEEYILEGPPEIHFDLEGEGPLVGLNTGCGGRWTSRLWPDEYWVRLAEMLGESGYRPLFLGGEQEHEKNSRLAALSNGLYPGHFPLKTFMSLMNRCDLIVTGVTMAMHIAIGLRKKLILFNNIFNPNEFELYGRGEILEPSKTCTCFFRPECVNPEYTCMEHLESERVLDAVRRWLPLEGTRG